MIFIYDAIFIGVGIALFAGLLVLLRNIGNRG